jgi:hypothetical protein
LSQRRLSPSEVKFLEEASKAEYVNGSIRLREGEYQFNLVNAIAAFELELTFPDVKDLIRKLWGEEKTNDLQFVRKVQTILKKMEKGNIVRILPKKNPWQLQRYAVSSFKFQDSDKSLVTLATDQQIKQMKDSLHSVITRQEKGNRGNIKPFTFALMIVLSYALLLVALLQPIINLIMFISGLSVSILCSLMLGKTLGERW